MAWSLSVDPSTLAYMTTSNAAETITNLLPHLSEQEKRDLYYTLGQDLLVLDEQAVVTATRRLAHAYLDAGYDDIASIEFGAAEYDNGYFLSPHDHTLRDAKGKTIKTDDTNPGHPGNLADLDDDAADDLHEALDFAFGRYADASLGSTASLTVDLKKGKVTLYAA